MGEAVMQIRVVRRKVKQDGLLVKVNEGRRQIIVVEKGRCVQQKKEVAMVVERDGEVSLKCMLSARGHLQ